MPEVVESRNSNVESQSVFHTRREQMLHDKIDYASSKLTCNNELALLVRVAVVYLFSRSLLSCHRSYVNSTPKCYELFRGPRRRSLSKIINLLHLSPKIGRFSGAPNTHLVLISLIVERLFHRTVSILRTTNQRKPIVRRLLGTVQIGSV